MKAEREVAGILSDLLGFAVRRRYNLGTHTDTGDLILPDTVIQVVNRKDVARAVREKLPEAERQRVNADALFAAVFVRLPGGRYFVALTPEGFANLWREANS